MIDTAELHYLPSQKQYYEFVTHNETYYYKQKNYYFNSCLKEYGIRLYAFDVSKEHYSSYVFVVVVRFKQVLDKNNIIDVAKKQDIGEIKEKFNKLISKNGFKLPSLNQWLVSRIDYCINLETLYVDEYTHLLKKGDKPYYWNEIDIETPTNLYLKGKSSTVNFYNKQSQLKDIQQENPNITDEQIKLSENILRLEIQCYNSKVGYLKKKYDNLITPSVKFILTEKNIPSKSLFLLFRDNISIDTITSALKRIVKSGDYQRKSIALQMINKSNYRKKVKDDLILIIKEISKQHQSIYKIRNNLDELGIMNKSTFNRRIKQLGEMNINPVTISDTRHIENKSLKEGLPNLLKLIDLDK